MQVSRQRRKNNSHATRESWRSANLGNPRLARGAGCGAHRPVGSFQSMFLQPAIHGAAAQPQSLGCLAYIPFVAGESALDEIPLNFVEAHLLELGRAAGGLRAQTEVCCADGRAGRKEHAAFHRMIEFANVARPRMLVKSLDGGGVESGKFFAVTLRVTVEKMVRKEVDVLAAVTQRRDVDLDGIQAKEKVLSEPAGSGLRVHVGVGSREHPHIDAPSGGRADALEIPCFQNAQEFRLQVERDVGDFVQEQRAAVSEFESPDAIGPRIGKGAFYMSEELAFENTFG